MMKKAFGKDLPKSFSEHLCSEYIISYFKSKCKYFSEKFTNCLDLTFSFVHFASFQRYTCITFSYITQDLFGKKLRIIINRKLIINV
jgi:hypothetical protein